MVDVSHEPRWGRISEAAGEDPYLGSVFAAARVKAAQGADYSAPDKVVASVKHFAAYGQPEGGREYNTTDMSESRLRNLYLPPFKAAIDAGADTVMCSFNAINGVPGCANPELETDILKGEWRFDGFIESDYTAVAELRACPPKTPDTGPCGHGVAADGPGAAAAALNAGTDSEMVSTNIRDFGKQLLAQHRITMARLDDAVRRILRVKFRAGLFDHPYVDQAKAAAPEQLRDGCRPRRGARRRRQVDGAAQERRRDAAARPGQVGRRDRAAGRRPARHARPVVGPGHAMTDAVSRARRHQGAGPEHDVRPGLHDRRQGSRRTTRPTDECGSDAGFAAAVAAAQARPTRSCSRSARAAGRAARPRRAARSTCPASSRS